MPYIGKSPLHGNYSKLDDFSGDFDGSDATHALAANGISITPVTEAALLISINGVLQEPVTDYTVSGTNITFTTAPASGVNFFGVALGEQLAGNTPSNSTITSAKLSGTFLTGASDIGAAIADADLFLIDDGAGGTLRKTTASRLKTYIGGSDPASADGDSLGTASAEWSDLYLADGGIIYFGNDQDVTVTHVADTGLTVKNTHTSGNSGVGAVLTLQTGDTDVADGNILGHIKFQAPDEGTGSDAILVAAAIAAESEGDFSSSNNATSLVFQTGASEAAATKMTLTSAGALDVTGDITGSTLNADGDTAAGDNAAIGYTAGEGLILTGQGSTSDITVKNDADGTVFTVPTGTDDILFPDSAKAMWGAGSDMLLYHDGSNSYITNAVGALKIATETSGIAVTIGHSTSEVTVADNLVVTGTATAGGNLLSQVGTQTIWVPAIAMRPTVSNGCASITNVETTSGRPDMQVLDFDDGSDEHAQFQIGFPKSWNEGTITFRVFWTTTATDTDGVAWGLQGVSVANDGTIDVAYGTAVVVTDDNISAAEDCLVTATSSAVTIASAAANTLTYFRIFRDVSDGNDDMAEDARLLGIQIFYTTDAVNDA